MFECSVEPPYCTTMGTDSDCGTAVGARLFFYSYILLVTYILMGLFLAVILENLSTVYTRHRSLISQTDLDRYVPVGAV
jgi:hypothetical protein